MSTVPFNLLASNHLVIIPLQCLVETGRNDEAKQQKGEKKRLCVTKAINGEIARRKEDIRGVNNSMPLVVEACMALTGDNKTRWQLLLP